LKDARTDNFSTVRDREDFKAFIEPAFFEPPQNYSYHSPIVIQILPASRPDSDYFLYLAATIELDLNYA
jgi:hypothetical protein